ncbi:Predicted ATPase [Flavobacterium sp. CF108]|uniref:AAA family ATPase n=1 Tax=unclassified Flavobacterium TaxID=196869 RepID=UPI0008CA37F3|nr:MULTISPECIES: AAA family ATPase [unclassified Flavobacterium]SEP16553.1 Predicted ATPase [Flavobacterium sp. fv08]SHH46401.1 Predicted ATPase [Flavobacterium sp. CF108]
MTKLIIRNIGPISDIEIELNKVNVFMGPQSSGKSTIAKIISYCQWVEKRYLLDGQYEDKIEYQLLDFHRLSEAYFSEKSYFKYSSDFIEISYKWRDNKENIIEKENSRDYLKTKNIYIPSERNFVSVIPNLSKYKETNDNIMNFVYDWYAAKKNFQKGEGISVLNLDVNFHNDKINDLDVITLKNKEELYLRAGSSGLQSVIPLVLLVEYLTNGFYKEDVSPSVAELNYLSQKSENSGKIINVTYTDNKGVSRNGWVYPDGKDALPIHYHKTQFIIEEPEQNLFPETQRDLIYYLFNKIQGERDHSLILTTHSPYILYAINNCLMGSVISDKLTEEEKKEFLSFNSWISPSQVNVFEIDSKNGALKSIKNSKTGTVDKHYFNTVMNDIMNEYYEMLNHFEYEE